MRATPRSIDELDEVITQPPAEVIDTVNAAEGDFLVIGAGGKMGFHLCRMLQRACDSVAKPSRVVAVSRFSSKHARQPFAKHRIETVAADASQVTELERLPDAASVFYLAGVKFGTSSSPDQLEKFNVRMPGLVAERYRDSHIVALSTGCVYAFTKPASGGSTEQSKLDPPGQYAASCIGRERAFESASRRNQTPCVLVRLNYSVEFRYGVLVDIAQQVFNGQPVDLRTGFVNVIWQGDAVAQIIRCLSHVCSPPPAINVTGPDILSVRELANRFAEIFGTEVTFSGTEAETAWLSNSAVAQRLFGMPRVDIDQMIVWIADWLQRGGETLSKPTHFQNRDGNY